MKWHLLFLFIMSFTFQACATDPASPPPTTTPTPSPEPQIQVIAEGLLGPIGLAILPDGGLLVAEAGTGDRDESAGVSLITADGKVSRLISGLPSSRDAGDLAGVNLVALSPDQDKIYLGNFGQGHLWVLQLTAEQQTNGLQHPTTPLTIDDLTPAMVRLNNVLLTNPFDLAFDTNDRPVVTDASGNGVATENENGTTRFLHRFDPLPDPSSDSDRVTIDPVPTGITRVQDEYYVTLTGGCPYPAKSGRLVAIDEQRNQRTIRDDLNMPIDVALGPDGTIWVLEFAQFTPGASCFSGEGYQPNSGRLSQLQADGQLEPMLSNLNFPGAVLPINNKSVYLSEVFTGRILQITFP